MRIPELPKQQQNDRKQTSEDGIGGATMASAYEFDCDMSMEEMLTVLNNKGSWQWTIRDSYWYGDYLNCRPQEGVRIRIHHPAEFFGVFSQVNVPERTPDPEDYYTGLFTIESNAAGMRDAVDEIFRNLLNHLQARNVREIESYD